MLEHSQFTYENCNLTSNEILKYFIYSLASLRSLMLVLSIKQLNICLEMSWTLIYNCLRGGVFCIRKHEACGWRVECVRGRQLGPSGRAVVVLVVIVVVLQELNKRLLLCRLETGSDYYKNITLNLRDNTIGTPNAVIYDVFSLLLLLSTLTHTLIQLSSSPRPRINGTLILSHTLDALEYD